jgi:FixJ family two-component response regulator
MSTETNVIAVIDDDPTIRKALRALLSSLGYTVELYDSSEAFLQRAAACRAKCLLIDVQLGSSSGIELARQLAKAGLRFPIMFMTANGDKAVQRQAIEVGCVGYLLKPFAAELLMNVLAEPKIGERKCD